MGACVSTHHKPSATKLQLSFGSNSKPDNHLVIPTKEKPPIFSGDVAVKPQWPPLHSTANSRDFGSKEETFFDSQAWLESDCEDEFMSVNGEFTPSRGNSPVHHDFSARTPQINGGGASIDDHRPSVTPLQPSPSPTKKKMRLSELLKDAEPANEAPFVHGGEMAQSGGGLKPKRERWAVSVQGCFPNLLSSCRLVTPQQTEGRTK